jgi:hypothetical protein
VYATSKAHIEVVEVAPRLHLLHDLLAERPYTTEEEQQQQQEEEGTGGTYHDQGTHAHSHGDDVAMGCDQAAHRAGCYTLEQLLERVQVGG